MPSLRASTKKQRQAKLDFSSTPNLVTRELRSMSGNEASTSPIKKGSPAASRRSKAHSSPVKSSPGGLFGKGRRKVISDSEDDAQNVDDADDDESLLQSRSKRHRNVTISSSDRDVENEDAKDTLSQIGEAETSSDGIMNSSPMKKPRASKQIKRKLPSEEDYDNDSNENNDNDDDDDDDDDIIRPSRKRQTPKTTQLDSQTSDDSDVNIHNRKRKRLSRPRHSEDEEELKEELDDLRASSPILTPVSNRKDKMRMALEKLKRRRERRQSGDKILSSEEESNSEDSEAENHYTLRYQEQEQADQDEYEDDFLDDEDMEDDLEDVLAQRPIQFTKWAHTDLEQLFSHAIEWLIQNKINPGFDRNADIYTETWRRLNNEILGMAESKFKSSSWVRDFIVSLESRPIMEETHEYAEDTGSDCQACNRSRHPATYKVALKGKPYDPKSLEPLEPDEAEYYDYDRDVKDREVPHEREWFLGKTCFDNAKNAHLLEHWRYSLNVAVMDQLKESGVFKHKRIVERSDWSVIQKTRYTREVMDVWEKDGVNRDFWGLYTDFTSTARMNKKGTFQY
jgi:hypothetical protein